MDRTQEQIDREMLVEDEDGPEPGEECGRWSNGRLGRHCAKAGSEECGFECPYRRGRALSLRCLVRIDE